MEEELALVAGYEGINQGHNISLSTICADDYDVSILNASKT